LLFPEAQAPGAQQQQEVVDNLKAEWYQGMVPGLTVMLMRRPAHSARWAPQTYFNPTGTLAVKRFLLLTAFLRTYGRYPTGS
jgi:D-alanyl-D-alanine carboxypeptidase